MSYTTVGIVMALLYRTDRLTDKTDASHGSMRRYCNHRWPLDHESGFVTGGAAIPIHNMDPPMVHCFFVNGRCSTLTLTLALHRRVEGCNLMDTRLLVQAAMVLLIGQGDIKCILVAVAALATGTVRDIDAICGVFGGDVELFHRRVQGRDERIANIVGQHGMDDGRSALGPKLIDDRSEISHRITMAETGCGR